MILQIYIIIKRIATYAHQTWNEICSLLDILVYMFLYANTMNSMRHYENIRNYWHIVNNKKSFLDLLHVQLFAAEDEGRTFDPTEHKIRKAREEGRVAKTQELPSSLVMLGGIVLIWVLGGYFSRSMLNVFQYYLGLLNNTSMALESATVTTIIVTIMKIVLPIFTIVFIAGILGNVVQFGWAPSTKSITPDFSRVKFNVGKWLEKIFSIQGVYSLSLSIIKLFFVTLVLIINVLFRFDIISKALDQSLLSGMILSAKIGIFVILESAIMLIILSFVDFRFQSFLFKEQLKMTRQEIKDELKESEGDPEIKQRIKRRMQEFMNKNVKENVSDSDVLVTNPTHFAIALKYDRDTMIAPKVMAKGEDQLAFRMRRLAKEYEIPIIENKPLARALYSDLEVGEEIPERYYRAVVIIFEQIYKMKGEYV